MALPRTRSTNWLRRRPRVTLDQLHTFLAVAELEHVTAAAAALDQSQGSVSAAIQRLEDTLGLPLLHRVGRNVRLTDVGKALRQLATRTLREAELIEELTEGYLAFERGEVAIAAGRVMGAHRLSRWLAPFVREHPDIEIRLALLPMHEVLGKLGDGTADVVIVGADVHLPETETLLLEHTELVIVVAAEHPLATSRDPMHELQQHRHLAHERGTATRLRADRLVPREVDDSLTLELEEGALLAALMAGLGYAVMPRSVVEGEVGARRLVVLRRPGRPVTQRFTAARRTSVQTPAVEAFWQHLRRVSATSPPGTRRPG